MKKLLLGLTLLASLSSFSNETTPKYLVDQDKIDSMLNRITENEVIRYKIVLEQTLDLSFYDRIPLLNYVTLTSALENAAEDDGILEIMDIYCTEKVHNSSRAYAIKTSFGPATDCAVQMQKDSFSACMRYDFSCE